MTKFKLMMALLQGQGVDINGQRFCSLCSIEREDGSNHSFNVKGYVESNDPSKLWELATVCVRTID